MDSVSERYYIQESVDIEMGRKLNHVEGILHTLLQFCQRNSNTVEERERQVGGAKTELEVVTDHFPAI